jgi:anti-sigma factor RsiW
MNCHDAQSWLHGYLDGELDPPTTLQYEQHVRECPACAKTLAEQKALQTAMKADALYYRAPEYLRDRLRASLCKQSRSSFGRFPWRIVAAAACLIFCVGLGFLAARFTFAPSARERVAQEVASAHIRSMQAEHLVDKASSDRHEVKPWFNGRLDFSPPTPDLSKEGFSLVGGRMDYIDGKSVAALVYRRRKHIINVFIWPDSANQDAGIRREAHQSYNLFHWSRGGMNYWVVSDLDPAELNELVQRLRE